MVSCKPKSFILYQGYPSRWDGVDWLSLSFKSETKVDFTGFSAKFKIGNFIFENNDLTQEWIINLTDEQTRTLMLGMNTASLIVYDTLGEGKPFTTSIPVFVKNWVEGDVEIETYKATIKAILDNKNEFIVNVETAKVNLEWVEDKIAEHNNSTDAHPYIRGLISSETEARENADSSLSQRITENTNRFSNYRTRVQQDVIDNAQNLVIEGKQDKLTTSQMESVNSGITSSNVNQITLNKNAIANEIVNRQNADNNLQSQIDVISASSDVTDIVGTYAELQQYDTSKLKDNDIVKVLNDESQNGEMTYYRWNSHTHAFSLIGEEGPYYTKSQADETFVPQTRTVNGKDLSNNISLDANDVGALPDSTVIPIVNNGTLTIQKNGILVQTFTANQSSNVTANITVPTNNNELENGAGYITNAATFYWGE